MKSTRSFLVFRFLIFFLVVIVLGIVLTSAHSNLQGGIIDGDYYENPESGYSGYLIGGENVGWYADETDHHIGQGVEITFRFDEYDYPLTNAQKTAMINGAAMWNVSSGSGYPDANITICQHYNGVGLIQAKYLTGMQNYAVAYWDGFEQDSNGHYTDWVIVINNYRTFNAVDAAHELGHAIGLLDLYELDNADKLMFGSVVGRTATRPTEADVKGAKVISGQHTSHTWAYRRVTVSLGGNGNTHHQYCTVCNGIKKNSLASCNFGSANRCLLCKSPKDISLNNTPSVPELQ